MPRLKQARRTTVQDIRTILRLTHEQGLSAREAALRLKLSKTTVASIAKLFSWHHGTRFGAFSWLKGSSPNPILIRRFIV